MSIGDSVGEKAAQILADAGEKILAELPAEMKQGAALLQALLDRLTSKRIVITFEDKTP